MNMWLVYAQSEALEREALLTPNETEARAVYQRYKDAGWAVTLAQVVEDWPGWMAEDGDACERSSNQG